MTNNTQRGMDALFKGNALGFRHAVNKALMEKVGKAIDARRRTILEGEQFAPGQPNSEREMIDLHGMEMHNEPNADENNFTADYIEPDDSEASGQRDANENDVPTNSAEKLKKVVMHGTGDRVYDDEEADDALGEEEEHDGDDPEKDEDEDDEDRRPFGEGYIQEKSLLKRAKRAAQRLNPNSPASKVHRFKKSIRGVSGAAHGTLRSKKLVRKIAQESADLEEGVWNKIKRFADKASGRQRRRVIAKATDKQNKADILYKDAANRRDSAGMHKHADASTRNYRRMASNYSDGGSALNRRFKNKYGRHYLSGRGQPGINRSESLQLTERNKENASKRRAWQAGHSVYGPKARENKKTGKLVQGDRFASQSAARLSSFQHDSQDRTHGKGNVADARRAGRKALAGKHGSDLARHVDQKKGFAKLDRKAGGAPAKATRRAKRNRKG